MGMHSRVSWHAYWAGCALAAEDAGAPMTPCSQGGAALSCGRPRGARLGPVWQKRARCWSAGAQGRTSAAALSGQLEQASQDPESRPLT